MGTQEFGFYMLNFRSLLGGLIHKSEVMQKVKAIDQNCQSIHQPQD